MTVNTISENHRVGEQQNRSFGWLKIWVFPLLFFSLLTVVITWPLVKVMGDYVVGQIGDNIYMIWLIAWFQKALFVDHVSPFFAPNFNFPDGWKLGYTEISSLTTMIGVPFSLVGGPTLGFNFSVLFSFVISGWGAYLFVHRLTQNIPASTIAGTIFAISPYRYAHYLAGHSDILGTQWLPFYFMFLLDVLQLKKWSWKPILLAALFFSLNGFTSQYYTYMTAMVAAAFILGYILFVDRQAIKNIQFWLRLVATHLLALPLIIASAYPYLQLAGEMAHYPRPMGYARTYSASITDFFLPPTTQFIWGSWVGKHFDRSLWIEATLYLGIFVLILAAIALFKRKKIEVGAGIIWMLGFSALAAFILALGTDLHWLSQPVELPVPEFLRQWINREQIPIPLPGYLLYKFLPYYNSMRAWMRYGIYVMLFVGALAGLGIDWLLRKAGRRWAHVLTIGIFLLILLDFFPAQQSFSKVQARPVDYWLAEQPGKGSVAVFPFWKVADPEQMYYALTYDKPFVGAFYNAYASDQYHHVGYLFEAFPDEKCLELFKQLKVQYVLVDSEEYDNFSEIEKQIDKLGLKLLKVIDGYYVYEYNG